MITIITTITIITIVLFRGGPFPSYIAVIRSFLALTGVRITKGSKENSKLCFPLTPSPQRGAMSIVPLPAAAHKKYFDSTPLEELCSETLFEHAREIKELQNASDLEIQEAIDTLFLLSEHDTSPYATKDGQWIHIRHEDNDRGDESTVDEREQSVWRVGVLEGIRRGPWRVQHEDLATPRYKLLHWASLNEGVRRCSLRDTSCSNRAVQHTLKLGLTDIKTYHRKTPRRARRFLVMLGNRPNAEAQGVTILQAYRIIPEAEAMWQRRKQEMGWTFQSEGQSSMNEKKLSLLSSMWPYWKSYRSVEISMAAWNSMHNSELNVDNESLWKKIESIISKEVDLKADNMNKFSDQYQNLHLILRIAKGGYLQNALAVLKLCMPMLERPGKCTLNPEGCVCIL